MATTVGPPELLAAATPVIGHVYCREDVLAAGLIAAQLWAGPDYGQLEIRPPDVTFSHRLTLHLGSRQVELIHVGPAHTRSDVLAWLPDDGVVFAGDLAFNGGQPFLLEGSLAGFLRALAAVRALEADVLVSGHGPVCRGAEIARVLDDMTAYAEFVAEVAAAGHRSGRPPLAAAQAADPGRFGDWQEAERLVGNLHRAYSELDGEPLGLLPVAEPPRVGSLRRRQRRTSRAVSRRRDLGDELGVRRHVVEHAGDLGPSTYRAVTRHQHVGLQRPYRRQRAQETGEAAFEQKRLAAVEGQVAGEDHTVVGQPRQHVAPGVRRADVNQLYLATTQVQGKPVGERNVGRADLQLAVVGAGEQLRGDQSGSQHVLAAVHMPDHRGRGRQQPVAVGVVAVVVGVHQRPRSRRTRHLGDPGQQRTVAGLRRCGVDHEEAGVRGHQAGVVDHPAAVRLDISPDAGRDLQQLRWAHCGCHGVAQ